MQTVGTAATDWANDGLFGDGWHLFGIGSSQAAEAEETYGDSDAIIEAFNAQYGNDDIAEAIDLESKNYSEDAAKSALTELVNLTPSDASVTYSVQDEETLEITETPDTKNLLLKRLFQTTSTQIIKRVTVLPMPQHTESGFPVFLFLSATALMQSTVQTGSTVLSLTVS